MTRPWDASPTASFVCRLGKSPSELGVTTGDDDCPDMWQLDNGDIAVIGRDRTDEYRARLPEGVRIAEDERLVIIPGVTLISAKQDIPDA